MSGIQPQEATSNLRRGLSADEGRGLCELVLGFA